MSKTETRLKALEKKAGPDKPVIVLYQDLTDPDLYHLANQDGETMTEAEAINRYPEASYYPIFVTYYREPIPGELKL